MSNTDKRFGENSLTKLITNIKTMLENYVKKESGKGLSTNDYTTAEKEALAQAVTDISAKAPSYNPTFTGIPTAPTADAGTSNTQIATTAFVQAAVSASYSEVSDYTDDEIQAIWNTVFTES